MSPETTPDPFLEVPPDALCPSCGEFVGTARRCPHCGARSRKRLSLVLARWMAVAVAVLGLVALYQYVNHREIELIRIGDLKPTMNFAYVRVEGTVPRSPFVARGDGGAERINFEIDDGTGTIRVTAYRSVTERLDAEDRIPRAGERVSVAGTVQFTGEEARLLIQVPDHLRRYERPVESVPLDRIGQQTVGRVVRTRGVVTGIHIPPPESRAPYRVELQANGKHLPLVFWQRTWESIPSKEDLRPGTKVEVRAAVQTHRGDLQLLLEDGKDLKITGQGEAPQPELPAEIDRKVRTMRIADLGPDKVGLQVRIDGEVRSVVPPAPGSRAPTRVALADETGREIEVVYWDDVAGALEDAQRPRPGMRLRVEGAVDEYRGRLQVRVTEPEAVIPLGKGSPAESPSGPPEELRTTPIGSIHQGMEGRTASVRGEVTMVRPVRGGRLITLRDESGEMTLPLWNRIFSGEPPPVRTGDVLRITGEVTEYKGRMEVLPAEGSAVSKEP